MQVVVLRAGFIEIDGIVEDVDTGDRGEGKLMAGEMAEEEVGRVKDGGVAIATSDTRLRAEETREVGRIDVPTEDMRLVQEAGTIAQAVRLLVC